MITAIFDYKENRIPNILVIIIGIIGITLLVIKRGVFYTMESIGICILACFVMYPLYCLRLFGAGDVKLYALLPIYCFRRHILQLYLLVFCVGAVLGLIKLLFTSDGRSRIIHIVDILKSCISLQCNTIKQVLPIKQIRIPMAIPFAIGIILAMVLEISNTFIFFEV